MLCHARLYPECRSQTAHSQPNPRLDSSTVPVWCQRPLVATSSCGRSTTLVIAATMPRTGDVLGVHA